MGSEKIHLSIIEDDAIFAEALRMVGEDIRASGFDIEIDTFLDGNAFVQSEVFHSKQKQVVLLNDNLTKLDGFEVTRRLRELPNSQHIFVIMMSMGTTEEEIIHAFKIGIDDFITRPLNLRILQTFMERVIERLRGEDEPIL